MLFFFKNHLTRLTLAFLFYTMKIAQTAHDILFQFVVILRKHIWENIPRINRNIE